jgi:hypothetical protein
MSRHIFQFAAGGLQFAWLYANRLLQTTNLIALQICDCLNLDYRIFIIALI